MLIHVYMYKMKGEFIEESYHQMSAGNVHSSRTLISFS